MSRILRAALVGAIAVGLLAPVTASAGCPKAAPMLKASKRNRSRLGKKVSVKVRYSNTQGFTVVDPTGIYFYIKNKGVKKGSHNYPAKYWYDAYPLYVVGQTMTYKVVVRNKTKRPLRNLRVVAQHEYLNNAGKDGEDLPGCSRFSWVVPKLKRNSKWVGVSSWKTAAARSGLDQTHVQIQRYRRKSAKKAKLLLDRPQAGIFCPPTD